MAFVRQTIQGFAYYATPKQIRLQMQLPPAPVMINFDENKIRRIIKLKRGKSLLDQGRTNISEVADMVGLSAKQFAHYFKLMYDDTPSEYLKKKKE